MKKIISLLLCLMFMFALFGCASKTPAENSGSEISQTESAQSSEPVDLAQGKTIACCMGAIYHPVHRVVQYGFCTKAEELGMVPIVSGLESGAMDELISQWETDISLNNAVGALIWTGDDSCYEMMKELKQQGVYTVVPHFIHDYERTQSFIDKDIAFRESDYGKAAADFIVERLIEAGITEGSIGITLQGTGIGTGVIAYDAFSARIKELGGGYSVLPPAMEGNETTYATNIITNYIKGNPDMVAGFGTTGYSPVTWAAAMENADRGDIIAVGVTWDDANITLIENGTIAGTVCLPVHEEAAASVTALYDMVNGKVFNTNENTWLEIVEAPVASLNGEGKNNIQTYRDIYDAAQAYFEE